MAVKDQVIKKQYAIYNGDSCEVMPEVLRDNSIHMSVFSPPFADLYCYSDNDRDMGNCETYEEFFHHFSFIISELYRATMPGRNCLVHAMDIPATITHDGFIGLKDFPGDIIRAFTGAGFIYHSRTVIWKDPLIAAVRTKAIGLMHKQLCKDSAISRAGIPDCLLAFRKPGENPVPISHPEGLTKYVGAVDPGGEGVKRSHFIWQKYASPVWMDIRQGNTLDAKPGRDPEDEKHLCPLQLDVIERAVTLWSNPGEIVFTPFLGVGSEAYGAVLNGRKAIGIELKPSYYAQAVKNLAHIQFEVEEPELPGCEV